jgi:hypothetical protein
MRCHEAVQARAPARARARASFWKTGSHQHRRRIREMQFRVKRAAPPSSHRSQGCQLPSAKPNVGHVAIRKASIKHKPSTTTSKPIMRSLQCSAVQCSSSRALLRSIAFPLPQNALVRVPYHVRIRTDALSLLFASRSKFTRCRGSVPPYGTERLASEYLLR